MEDEVSGWMRLSLTYVYILYGEQKASLAEEFPGLN